MNRFEYLAALKEALSGLPEDVVKAVVADYERRFFDRSAAGQSEDEIIGGLDDPKKVAAEQRAAFQLGAFKEKKSAANFARLALSVVGLLGFNLFMLAPAMIYLTLLISAYVLALALYGVGILVTAANLAGVSGVTLHDPFDRVATMQQAVATDAVKIDGDAAIDIDSKGIRVQSRETGASVRVDDSGVHVNGQADSHAAASATVADEGMSRLDIGPSCIYLHAAGRHANKGVSLGVDCVIGESRLLSGGASSVSWVGIGMTLGGILLFLLCLAVSKLTIKGLCRLVQMEVAVLKNA